MEATARVPASSIGYLEDSMPIIDGLRLGGVGVWRWKVGTEELAWTSNLEALHALPQGSFDGTLASFQRDVHPEDGETVWKHIQATLETGAPYRVSYRTMPRDGAEPLWIEASGAIVKAQDGNTYLTGICLDVTLRMQGELELTRRLAQQRAIEQLGSFALSEPHFQAILDRAVEMASEVLDVPLTKILQFSDSADHLLLKAGVGWQDGLVGHGKVGIETESQAGFTLLSEAPVIVADMRTEDRFSGPQLLHDHGVCSGMSVIIPGDERRPFGVFGIHDTQPRTFAPADCDFLVSLANIIATSARQFAANEHRMLLIREMAHRAGNMLQLVSSIANQTFGTASDIELARHAFNDRLGSLSRANYLVAKGGWTSTRFLLLAEETLQPFRHRLNLAGRDILLPPELCFDLGLVLHELATNSVKYGTLGESTGEVSLDWSQELNADGSESFVMVWSDPEPVRTGSGTSAGFGSKLLTALVERKWAGRAVREDGPGYRLRITIPLLD